MIVATVLKSGGIYTQDHVYKIADMVKRFVPCEEFVCLSDLELNIKTIPLEDNWSGWWAKIELFKINGPVLYFDLDTIILNDLSDTISKVKDLDFVILRDFYRKGYSMQSSMMYWNGDKKYIYDRFKLNKTEFYGDQEFIETVVPTVEYWQDISDGIVSFKCDVLRRGMKDTSEVVIFHGEPKPWGQNVIPY